MSEVLKPIDPTPDLAAHVADLSAQLEGGG